MQSPAWLAAQALPAARYAQVQIRMSSDGGAAPWLDWIDLIAR